MIERTNKAGERRYGSKELRTLYRHLRDERPEDFRIESTWSCVIGQASKLFRGERPWMEREDVYETLGLSKKEGRRIDFEWPETTETGAKPPTLDDSIAMLRRAIRTGEVRW